MKQAACASGFPIGRPDQSRRLLHIFYPHCPWHFVRDNRLSNGVFKSYDDIIDHCCEAWDKLTAQLWRVMSIGTH
jgi:hypothetical protein